MKLEKDLALLAGRCVFLTDSLWPMESWHFFLLRHSMQRGECSRIKISCILLVGCVCIINILHLLKGWLLIQCPELLNNKCGIISSSESWEWGGKMRETDKRDSLVLRDWKSFLSLVEVVNSVILSVESVLPFSNDEYGRSKITLSWASTARLSTLPLNPGCLEFHTDGPVICMWCMRSLHTKVKTSGAREGKHTCWICMAGLGSREAAGMASVRRCRSWPHVRWSQFRQASRWSCHWLNLSPSAMLEHLCYIFKKVRKALRSSCERSEKMWKKHPCRHQGRWRRRDRRCFSCCSTSSPAACGEEQVEVGPWPSCSPWRPTGEQRCTFSPWRTQSRSRWMSEGDCAPMERGAPSGAVCSWKTLLYGMIPCWSQSWRTIDREKIALGRSQWRTLSHGVGPYPETGEGRSSEETLPIFPNATQWGRR